MSQIFFFGSHACKFCAGSNVRLNIKQTKAAETEQAALEVRKARSTTIDVFPRSSLSNDFASFFLQAPSPLCFHVEQISLFLLIQNAHNKFPSRLQISLTLAHNNNILKTLLKITFLLSNGL